MCYGGDGVEAKSPPRTPPCKTTSQEQREKMKETWEAEINAAAESYFEVDIDALRIHHRAGDGSTCVIRKDGYAYKFIHDEGTEKEPNEIGILRKITGKEITVDLIKDPRKVEGFPVYVVKMKFAERIKLIGQKTKDEMKLALTELHNEGYIHGDVSASNFVYDGDTMKLIDFACTRLANNDQEMEAEMKRVDEIEISSSEEIKRFIHDTTESLLQLLDDLDDIKLDHARTMDTLESKTAFFGPLQELSARTAAMRKQLPALSERGSTSSS